MIAKFSINLLKPELLPKKSLVSLNNLVAVWLLVLVVMLAWSYTLNVQLTNKKQLLSQTQQTNKSLNSQLNELQVALAARKTDSGLQAQLDTLKVVMANKQALITQLTDPNRTYLAGFANAMSELAKYHNKDVSLQRVVIAQDEIIFSGLAKTPDAIPQWLSGFEASTLLAGKNFKKFNIRENEQKITEFTIGSSLLSNNYQEVK